MPADHNARRLGNTAQKPDRKPLHRPRHCHGRTRICSKTPVNHRIHVFPQAPYKLADKDRHKNTQILFSLLSRQPKRGTHLFSPSVRSKGPISAKIDYRHTKGRRLRDHTGQGSSLHAHGRKPAPAKNQQIIQAGIQQHGKETRHKRKYRFSCTAQKHCHNSRHCHHRKGNRINSQINRGLRLHRLVSRIEGHDSFRKEAAYCQKTACKQESHKQIQIKASPHSPLILCPHILRRHNTCCRRDSSQHH